MVSGHADPGSLVTVNGFVVPLQGDRFSRNVSLSGGDNMVVVRAEDGAGNAVERRFAVTFGAGPRSPALGIGLASVGILIAAIIAFFIGRRFVFPPIGASTPEAEPEGPGVPPVPSGSGEESRRAFEEEPPPESSQAPPTDAADELQDPDLKSYDDALKDLETFEKEPATTSPPEDPRVAKLREAFESGKVSRDVYEANLARLRKGS